MYEASEQGHSGIEEQPVYGETPRGLWYGAATEQVYSRMEQQSKCTVE